MMKKTLPNRHRVWAAIILMVVLFLALWHSGDLNLISGGASAPHGSGSFPGAEISFSSASAKSEQNPSKTARVEAFLKEEAAKVGVLNPDPQATLANLQGYAETLEPFELSYLQSRALTSGIDGDERALAIFLLTLNPSEMALDLLKDISLAKIDPQLNGGLKDQEISFRALTIDGFSQNPNTQKSKRLLQTIAEQTDSSLVADRAKRALSSLSSSGETAPPAVQENNALKKLLQSSRN